MNTSTSLLEQALEALEANYAFHKECSTEYTNAYANAWRAIDAIKAAIAEQAKPQQEPDVPLVTWSKEPEFYTHPQAREPMSEEDLLGAISRGWINDKNAHKTMDSDLAVAIAEEVKKAIEAHHGIK